MHFHSPLPAPIVPILVPGKNTKNETKNYCYVSIRFNVNSSSKFTAMVERGIVPLVLLQPQVVLITIESNVIVLEYSAYYPAFVR